MQIICRQNCRVPMCEPVCPISSITVKTNTVYVDEKKCIGCGLCRNSCTFFSFDQSMKEKTLKWLMGKG